MGPGPIHLHLDRAPSHIYGDTIALANSLFTTVTPQPGKSPDTNMCDAGLFPWMEREVEAACAHSKQEINAAVEACWDRVTPDILQKVAARVRRNAQNTFDLEGGNFYDE